MTTVWTYNADDLFNPLDGGGAVRMIGATEAQTWGAEVEAAINALEGRIGTGGLLTPTTDDGAALGSAALKWSDLFLAAGGVINFNTGNLTITHSANALYFAGGSSGYHFDDNLFLASGKKIDFNSGDLTLTHSADVLTLDGGTFKATGALVAASDDAIPAGGTAGLGLMVSSTANFGVFFGSGAPTLSAAKGSLYLRSDGSSTSTRAYVNTNGSTTWASLTASA